MADKRFIYDQYGNIAREMIVHEQEYGIESFTTVQHEDVTAGLEYAKMKRELGHNRKTHWREAAWIPDSVLLRAMREGWVNDSVAWAKWANDPDNRAFRTDDGQRLSGRSNRR